MEHDVDVYKKLICDMIQGMTNEKFIKQIYSIVCRESKKEMSVNNMTESKKK